MDLSTILIAILVFVVIALAVGMIYVLHGRLNQKQMDLLQDALHLHEVGASRLAQMCAELACLNARRAVHQLRATLRSIRSKDDALALFDDLFYRQLELRLGKDDEALKIRKVVDAAPAETKTA